MVCFSSAAGHSVKGVQLSPLVFLTCLFCYETSALQISQYEDDLDRSILSVPDPKESVHPINGGWTEEGGPPLLTALAQNLVSAAGNWGRHEKH